MLEQIDKFKHFFTTFGRGICQGQGRGILEGPSAAPLRRSLPISMRHRQVEQIGTPWAWSNSLDTSLFIRTVKGRILPPLPNFCCHEITSTSTNISPAANPL